MKPILKFHTGGSDTESARRKPDSTGQFLPRLRSIFHETAGNDAQITPGFRLANAWLMAQPDSPTAQMYAAVFSALTAKLTIWPLEKLNLVQNALTRMDNLVNRYPDHFELRYLRFIVCSNLPVLFQRGATAQTDLDKLSDLLQTGTQLEPDLLRHVRAYFASIKPPAFDRQKKSERIRIWLNGSGEGSTGERPVSTV